MGNASKDKSVTVVTPTGKVYQYNYDKSIYYYGNVNIGQPINSNNFEFKTEKLESWVTQKDSSNQNMYDSNGDPALKKIEYEKVIVFPKQKRSLK